MRHCGRHSGIIAGSLLCAALVPGIWAATPIKKVLVYDKPGWYVHPDIGAINTHLKKMGTDNGFQVDVSSDPKVFAAASLAGYQVVVLNNISELGTSLSVVSQRNALQAWIEGGGGLVAFHGSGVVRDTWDWYIKLLGTDWYYDAAMQEGRVFIPPEAKSHLISEGALPEGRLSDEWNNFKVNVDTVPGITVTLAIDETSYDPTKKKNASEGGGVAGFRMADPQGRWVHPISWIRTEGLAGKGRVFYSCIGHDIKVFGTVFSTQHFLRAIQWAGGALEATTAFSDRGADRGERTGMAADRSGPARFLGSKVEWTGSGSYALEFYTPAGRKALSLRGVGPTSHSLRGRLDPGVYQVLIRTRAGVSRYADYVRVGI